MPISNLMCYLIKINRLIAEERSRSLAWLDRAGPKKLLAAVRKNDVYNKRESVHPLLADPNAVNNFFASVSYDSSYKKIQCDQLFKNTDCEISVESSEMERYLKRIKPGISPLFRGFAIPGVRYSGILIEAPSDSDIRV